MILDIGWELYVLSGLSKVYIKVASDKKFMRCGYTAVLRNKFITKNREGFEDFENRGGQ